LARRGAAPSQVGLITFYVARIQVRLASVALHTNLINLASDWLADNFPMEDRADGVRVRVREAEDDPVWRVVVDDNRDPKSAATSTTVTVVHDDNEDITFDVRCVAIPYGDEVGPPRAAPLPPLHLVKLVADAASNMQARDVGWTIQPRPVILATEVEGQGLGAIIGLPTRRLPILVFSAKPGASVSQLPQRIPTLLAGNAHCVVLDSQTAVDGVSAVWGSAILQPGTVAVIWPNNKGVQAWQIGGVTEDEATKKIVTAARSILEGACASLGPVRLPILRPTTEVATRATEDEVSEITQQLESLYDEIEELQSALSNAEQQLINKQDEVDDKERLLDSLVLQNVELAIQLGRTTTGVSASSMPDVLRQAKSACTNLQFHPDLETSINEFQFPEPTKVLIDLLRLNVVAGKWITNQIPMSTFGIECSNMGLTYTPNVSQTARQKYGEDYTFSWHGKEHVAGDHLSRGKGANHCRIYFFRDPQSREVVVCHIGRHLRDKTSN
jgi:hypothetical protein